LGVIKQISNRVAVMYLGKIVELGGVEDVYQRALHPYTRALLSSVPIPNPVVERRRQRIILQGDVPSPINPPSGCRFHTRCPIAIDRCRAVEPALVDYGGGHVAACWRAQEVEGLLPGTVQAGVRTGRNPPGPVPTGDAR